MTTSGQLKAAMAAGVFAISMAVAPARTMAQGAGAPSTMGTATIHGKVTSPVGVPLSNGTVKLTKDSNPSGPDAKFEYTFPIDANGDYKGSIKPGEYTAVAFQGANHVDFMPVNIGNGENLTIDFDMTRKAYLDKMSPEEKQQLEEFKKKNATVTSANAKIANLNAMLVQARKDTTDGNYDVAIKSMTDATGSMPDQPVLWQTLGDAQLGAAAAAEKANKTDPTLADKYGAAITSFQKALTLSTAAAKPNPQYIATADNQLGQAYGRIGKTKEATDAYEAAAKADPHQAGMYYYNEAATLFNANAMDDAAAAAQKAVTADPAKADAYYIEGQALIQKATVDPKTNKITAPPGCVEAYQKYLELAPTGAHAQEVKEVLQGIGATVQSTYKAPKK
ncbi:MAG TPA: hypothetical protein VII58_03185 [Acidobacteriaceae bacterium]